MLIILDRYLLGSTCKWEFISNLFKFKFERIEKKVEIS